MKCSKLALLAGLSAIAVTGLAGCSSGDKTEDNAVSPLIQSPVLNKADDSKMAGTDTGNATDNSTSGNSATGNAASNSSVPAPKMSKTP